MAVFRKALPIGAVILGASFGSGVLYAKQHSSAAALAFRDGDKKKNHRDLDLGCSSIPPLHRDDLELKFVQIFFRHGARTPFGHIPNIEKGVWNKDTLFDGASHTCVDYTVCAVDGGPQPQPDHEKHKTRAKLKGGALKGQLTAKGMRQAHDLGVRLKEHYVEKLQFLPGKYSPDIVYSRTTNIPRTIQSLGCLLGGLYGESINAQQKPVTLYTEPTENEILYINTSTCGGFKYHITTYWVNLVNSRLDQGKEEIARLLGVKEKAIKFTGLRDNLSARIEHDVDVPEILLPVRDLIEECAVIVMRQMLAGGNPADKRILRLSFGPAVHYICRTLEDASKNKIPYKLQLNSCHDTLVMALLLALEGYDDIWPPLAASVTFELYQDRGGNHFVRTLYKDKELKVCQSEDTLLPLEKFRQLLSPISVSPDEYINNVCELKT